MDSVIDGRLARRHQAGRSRSSTRVRSVESRSPSTSAVASMTPSTPASPGLSLLGDLGLASDPSGTATFAYPVENDHGADEAILVLNASGRSPIRGSTS